MQYLQTIFVGRVTYLFAMTKEKWLDFAAESTDMNYTTKPQPLGSINHVVGNNIVYRIRQTVTSGLAFKWSRFKILCPKS